jgi:aspartate-semialdehyde dehydrogenase
MKVGLIGWRGMVGSVLMQRMREEKDFELFEAVFFTTSDAGGKAPAEGKGVPLKDAHDLNELKAMDAIISCQGGDYTTAIFPKLRAAGWQGYWIDAASRCAWKGRGHILDRQPRPHQERWPTAARISSAATAPAASC